MMTGMNGKTETKTIKAKVYYSSSGSGEWDLYANNTTGESFWELRPYRFYTPHTPNMPSTPIPIVDWDTIKKQIDYYTPQICACCEELIATEDDGCFLEIGGKRIWFHRRCFADKENSAFIRSLLINEDLELV